MVSKILAIMKRNSLIIAHSKISSLILILGPILLILIAGFFLKDSSVKNMRAGVYFYESDEFNENFMNKLRGNSLYVEQESSLTNCIEKVLSSENHICIEIIKDSQMQDNPYDQRYMSHSLKLHVDYSKQRVVWQVIGTVQAITDIESRTIKDTMISDIHSKIDEIIAFTDKAETQINNILDNFNKYNEDYQDVKIQLSTIESEVNESIKVLDNARAYVLQLKSTPGLSADLLTYLNQMEGLLSNIETELQDIKEAADVNVLEQKLGKVEDFILGSRSKLIDLREDVVQKKKELLEIKELDMQRLTNPIPISYQSLTDANPNYIKSSLGFLDYFFPSFLILYILFSSLIFSSVLTIRERMSGSYVRNVLSKTSGFSFVMGNFLFCFFIIAIQSALFLLIGNYFLNVNLFSNIISLLIALVFPLVIFIVLGMIIGYLFNSQETVSITSVSIAILFLIFSSAITPKEFLPEIVSKIITYTPFSLFEGKFVYVIIFGAPFSLTLTELISIVATFIVLITALILVYMKSKHVEIK